jgi:hypothetical protein
VPATQQKTIKELQKAIQELYDIASNFKIPAQDYTIKFLDPYPEYQFIDYIDYTDQLHKVRTEQEMMKTPQPFIHDRNCEPGECFLCENADSMIYESRRAKMLKEAGTEL